MKIDDECSKVMTINTHKGLYKLNRFPFGLKVDPSLFQQVMDTMLAGLYFFIVYLDDILIKSENNNQHCDHIKEVFKRINGYGFKLSSEKCEFFMFQIKYLRLIMNAKGRTPDLLRAEAMKSMPVPNNVIILLAYLGLDNYYGIHIPNMQNLIAPLNNLLKREQNGIRQRIVKELSKKKFQPETRNCSFIGITELVR